MKPRMTIPDGWWECGRCWTYSAPDAKRCRSCGEYRRNAPPLSETLNTLAGHSGDEEPATPRQHTSALPIATPDDRIPARRGDRGSKGHPGAFSVFIPCDPPRATAQGSSRILRRRDGTQFIGRFATSRATKAKKSLLDWLTPHKPSVPFAGILRVSLLIEWPWLKSDSKATRNRVWIPVGTRPDCDNLAKMLCDALTDAGYWRDDGQIAHLTIIKQRGTEPGITVEIEEMEKIT